MSTAACPLYSPFFSFSGGALAMIFTSFGAAYGTALSGSAIAACSIRKPSIVMKTLLPVVFASVVSIYGLVVGMLITNNLNADLPAVLSSSFLRMGAGLIVGMCGLATGLCIGVLGEASIRAYLQNQKIFTVNVILLIFAEVLGLYGLIMGIMLNSRANLNGVCSPAS